MEEKGATLEKRVKKTSEPECWSAFEKAPKKTYAPVNRPGWYDVGINGSGDIDLADYEVVEET